jgi:putative flippase GtrA
MPADPPRAAVAPERETTLNTASGTARVRRRKAENVGFGHGPAGCEPKRARTWGLPLPTREVVTFLAVGGAGYITDVTAFNLLRDQPLFGGQNPVGAKVAAVALAMVVTYLGNRLLTWRSTPSNNQRHEVVLFAVFNIIGLLISVLTLELSHNMLGLTSRLADNISGNVIGVGLGTAFRYWSYRRFVFGG